MGKKTGDNRLAIEYVPLSTLERWPRNPKAHDDAGIARSVRRFGFNDPVARNTHHEAKFLLEGHGRLATLRKMHDDGEPPPANIVVGPDEWLVPTVTLCLPRGEAEAYALAHNQLTTAGGWDDDELASVIAELDSGGVDLSGLGWSDEELAEFIDDGEGGSDGEGGGGEDAPVDKAEELRKKWGTETGQLWQCGEHRIVCGDCTDPEVVAKVMGGERAQVLFTSPPYWVGFDYEQEGSWGKVLAFIASFAAIHVGSVTPDGRIIINTGTTQAAHLTGQKAHMRLLIDEWARAFEAHGWLMRYVRMWVKDGGLLHTAPQSDCIDQHTEFLGYFYLPGKAFRGQERTGEPWAGKGYWSDIPGAARSNGHTAAFPVELAHRNVILFARKSEAVLDPFLGSGTTMIACERLGRRCRGIELSPAYVAVCLERYFLETGKPPQLLA